MEKRRIVKLIVCLVSVAAAVIFIASLARLFGVMNTHGFEPSRYWVIAVFGLIFAFSVGLYSLIAALAIIISAAAELSHADEESALFLTLNGDSAAPAPAPAPAHAEAPEKKRESEKKLTRAERKRRKLLAEAAVKKKRRTGWFSVAVCVISTVFCIVYSVWARFPAPVCFHNYAYSVSENGTEPQVGEIRNFRFYADYLGTPFFVFAFSEDGSDEVDVKAISSEKTEETTVYTFYGHRAYAKPIDKLRNKITGVWVFAEVTYHESDSHISVSLKAVKARGASETLYGLTAFDEILSGADEVVSAYEQSQRIYSYRPLKKA